MKNTETSAAGGCGCLFLLVFYIPIVFWTDRNLDYWVSFVNKEPTDIPLWLSAILSIFEPIVVLDIIGEIARYFHI